MRALLLVTLLLLVVGCSAKLPAPELDPVKVQRAILELQAHIVAVEKKVGIVYPTPSPIPTKAP